MISIVLFGPPGSGKGTQSKYLINEFNLTHVAAGDILREAIKKQNDLGLKIKSIVESGNLLPDHLISKIIENFIKELIDKKGFIFDGYPRTLTQCLDLDEMLNFQNIPKEKRIAIHLNIKDNQTLVNRLINRSKKEKRSDDSNEEIIHNRLNLYYEKTLEAVNYYKAHYLFIDIDGNQLPETIKEEIFFQIQKVTSLKKG